MARKRPVLVVLGVSILAVGAAALFVGVGGVPGGNGGPGGDGDAPPTTAFPTGTPIDLDESAANGTADSTAPFSLTVDTIEECGRTCRDVTVTLTNQQSRAASDVEVGTRIYAGRNTTASDDLVWEGRTAVGTLAAGSTYTSTERVDLSLAEALEVERADGWVTIRTTVRSAEVTVTFRSSEQVA